MIPTYFASGTNHGAELLGFADCGIDVGLCVSELRGGALEALPELAARGIKLFVDSGAFGEIGFGPTGPFVAHPITAADWETRLATYDRIVDAMGSLAYVVAPDMVAFQAETLDRLTTYAHRVRSWHRRGANVLVPHQKGSISMADFHRNARAILGFADFVCAIPMKKDATTTAELAAFLEEIKPARVHLLGLGPKSPRYAEVLEAVRAASPATEIFCDSVAITALVGRTNGRGNGPRALTAAQDAAAEIVVDRLFAEGVEGLDYTDFAAQPGQWLTRAGVKRVAEELALEGADRAACIADIDAWLQDDDRYLDPRVELALDSLWSEHARKASAGWRKRTAIRSVFGGATSLEEAPEVSDVREVGEVVAEGVDALEEPGRALEANAELAILIARVRSEVLGTFGAEEMASSTTCGAEEEAQLSLFADRPP